MLQLIHARAIREVEQKLGQLLPLPFFHLAMGSKAILTPELDDEEEKWRVEIDHSSKVS